MPTTCPHCGRPVRKPKPSAKKRNWSEPYPNPDHPGWYLQDVDGETRCTGTLRISAKERHADDRRRAKLFGDKDRTTPVHDWFKAYMDHLEEGKRIAALPYPFHDPRYAAAHAAWIRKVFGKALAPHNHEDN